MIYQQEYPITRKIHGRSMLEITQTAQRLYAEHDRIEIQLRDSREHLEGIKPVIIDPRSILSLCEQFPFKDNRLTIIVSGDFDEEVLKQCADEMGKQFRGKKEE